MFSFHLGLQIPINITGSIFPPVVESGNFILFISLALHRRVLFSSKLLKKGKEELIIFSSTRKLSDSTYPFPLLPPAPRPSGQHLNSTFYLNRKMKFVFVLSLLLCYSSAQNANDPSEYIVQSNLREWLPFVSDHQNFPSESLTFGTSSKRPPPVRDGDHTIWVLRFNDFHWF